MRLLPAALALLQTLPASRAAPWAQEHGDAQMTGRAPPASCGPRAPTLAFTAPLPPMGVSPADAPTAGVLFGEGGALYSTSVHGTVWCLDERSGAPRWSRQLDAAPLAGLLLDAATGALLTGDTQGNLYAFDAASGAPRWRAQLGGSVMSTPALFGALVLVGVASGASGGTVIAFNATSGAPAWRIEVGTFNALFAPTLGTRAGGACDATAGCDTVFLASATSDGYLVRALDAASGAPVWAFSLGAAGLSVGTQLSLGGGRLFFGGATGAVALNASTGDFLWLAVPSNNTANPSIQGAPVVTPAGDTVFLSQYLSGYFALDAATGATRWALPALMASQAGILDSCGALFFVDIMGQVVSINSSSGAALWMYKTNASAPAPLGLSAEGRLAFVGGMGTAFVFGAAPSGGGSGDGGGAVAREVGAAGVAGAAAAAVVAAAAAYFALRRRYRRVDAAAPAPPPPLPATDPTSSTASAALFRRSIATSTADLQWSREASGPSEPLLGASPGRSDTIDSAVDVVQGGESGYLASLLRPPGAAGALPRWQQQQQLVRAPGLANGDSWVITGTGGGFRGPA